MACGLRPASPAYGIVSVQAAEENAPSLRVRTLQGGRHPAEIGRITHRSAERDKKSFKLREVVALIIANIFDVDIAGLLFDRLNIGSFIGIAAVGDGAVEPSAWYTSKGEKPLVLFCQGAGSEDGDRR